MNDVNGDVLFVVESGNESVKATGSSDMEADVILSRNSF